ncbi:hypothetical protein I7I53_02858 [Histoplasma capsulatum var. duboisii H88]|uniref:Uncharacterized protein n=1 Tax=Ajellomyces capsulatus (strain H88) TaxID=544711 RepID=A0A8A1LNT6_AJEC8|nr:hypothetical protein I7I53_02858 [Histoplasma capsulatum var. duboisii H88]
MVPYGDIGEIEFQAKEFELKPNTTYLMKTAKSSKDGTTEVETLRGLPILVGPDTVNRQKLDKWFENLPNNHKLIEQLPNTCFTPDSQRWMARILRDVLLHWQQSKEEALTQGFKLIVLSFLFQIRISISELSIKNLRCLEMHNVEPPFSSPLATLAVKGMLSDRFEIMSDDILERLSQSLQSEQHDTALCLLILLAIIIAGMQIAVADNYLRDENGSDARLWDELEELENIANDLIIPSHRRCETSGVGMTRKLVENLKSACTERPSQLYDMNVHDIPKENMAFVNESRLLSKLLDPLLSFRHEEQAEEAEKEGE